MTDDLFDHEATDADRDHDSTWTATYEDLALVADVRRLEPKLSRFIVFRVVKALRHLERMP